MITIGLSKADIGKLNDVISPGEVKDPSYGETDGRAADVGQLEHYSVVTDDFSAICIGTPKAETALDRDGKNLGNVADSQVCDR